MLTRDSALIQIGLKRKTVRYKGDGGKNTCY